MRINQVMQRDLVTALPSDSIEAVAKKMAERNVGSILLSSQGGKLEGIVTDRDIALAIAADGRSITTPCSAIMTTSPRSTQVDADLDAALEIMLETHARRLPVTENGRLVGIVSAADLAGALQRQFDRFVGLEQTYIGH